MHAAIKMCSQILLSGTPNNFSLGQFQQAYVFRGDSGACAAFLINSDGKQSAVVQFQNSSYELPRKSISILPDCKTVVFNTAKVNTQTNTRSMQPALKFDSAEQWEEFKEQVVEFDDTTIRADKLLEHMNTTKDVSDYLWYTVSLQQDSSDPKSAISVKSLGHVLHIFVNGELVGKHCWNVAQ
nr:beta-galactosidase 16-like [Ipomoea batatas]